MTATLTSSASWRAYARLATLDIFDYYLGALVVWSLLAPAARVDGQYLTVLVMFLVGEILLMTTLVALDDRPGYRDGGDLANYGVDAPARPLRRAPLPAGTLTERQVVRFAAVTTVLGTLLWTVAVLAAPHRPVWALVVITVTVVGCQWYSWGLKVGHRGFQAVYHATLGWALILVSYGLLTGNAPGFVLVQALLFGLGPLLFGVYSNTDDGAVGRLTVTAPSSLRSNAALVGLVSLAELALILCAPLAGAPGWFPLVMLPTILLRANQYRLGFRQLDILRARRLGVWVHRVTVLTLVTVNLLGGG